MSNRSRETRRLLVQYLEDKLKVHGYTLDYTNGGHFKVTLIHKSGKSMKCFAGSTPGKGNRSLLNTYADIKRAWRSMDTG